MLKQSDERVLKHCIMESFARRQGTPHALIELSKVEHKRLKENCIHLSDSFTDSKSQHLNYATVEIGSNIHMKRMCLASGVD